MKLDIRSYCEDFIENADGQRYYPNLSEEAQIMLEAALIRARLEATQILGAVRKNNSNLHPKKPVNVQAMGMSDLSLIVARLKNAGLNYHEILKVLVPDFAEKTEVLCGAEKNFDLLPAVAFNHVNGWGAYSKIIFSSTRDWSADALQATMRSVGTHPLKYYPPFVNELGLLEKTCKDQLPRPIFTPIKMDANAESEEANYGWHAVGAELMLPEQSEKWEQGIAPAGTFIAAMCNAKFFEASLAEINS